MSPVTIDINAQSAVGIERGLNCSQILFVIVKDKETRQVIVYIPVKLSPVLLPWFFNAVPTCHPAVIVKSRSRVLLRELLL